MLTINNLSVHYGTTRVVEDFSLELDHDEILMLVGPTGCGKTTILQAIAGLLPQTSGEISLADWTATTAKPLAPEKRNVGMVFQDFALFPHLSVEENVSFRLSDPAPANHWLELLGLSDFRNASPSRLSGGQKQRVALARALAHGPALMLLDEPLSNLDAAMKDSLRWEIRNALKAAGVPAIWVTHDQNEALSVGDRLGVLRGGKLEQLGSPETCFSTPANRFVARFLGEASFLPGKLVGNEVETSLGLFPAQATDGAQNAVEALLRPDDCTLQASDSDGNGVVTTAQYEGSTWLYSVQFDSGSQVQVRCHHGVRVAVGARVKVGVAKGQTLAVFGADKQ